MQEDLSYVIKIQLITQKKKALTAEHLPESLETQAHLRKGPTAREVWAGPDNAEVIKARLQNGPANLWLTQSASVRQSREYLKDAS